MSTSHISTFAVVLHVRDSNGWDEAWFAVRARNEKNAVRAARREARSMYDKVDRAPVRIDRY